MGYELTEIQYVDLEADGELRDAIRLMAEGIYHAAPSDAAIRIILRKSRNIVSVSCRIVSLAGVFLCETMGHSPLPAFQSIERQMKEQLDAWKAARIWDLAQAS